MVIERHEPTLSRKDLEDVIFRSPSLRRYTQDSPILPDVWFEFGQKGPEERVDLLMVPILTGERATTPGTIAVELRTRGIGEHAHLAYHESTVAAKLTFAELVRVVLPLANWRREFSSEAAGWQRIPSLTGPALRRVAAAMRAFERGRMDKIGKEPVRRRRAPSSDPTSPLVLWTLRLVGTIALAHEGRAAELPRSSAGELLELELVDEAAAETAAVEIVRAAQRLIGSKTTTPIPMIYSVARNRNAEVSVFRSVATVKADAAKRLFEIDARGLRWAVIDSGIDAQHPAFRRREIDPRTGRDRMVAEKFNGKWDKSTRVLATYDFTPVRHLLDLELVRSRQFPGVAGKRLQERLQERADLAEELRQTLEAGEPVVWIRFAPLLEIAHQKDSYHQPKNEHGTHVAGILAGDWRTTDPQAQSGWPAPDNDLVGVCPSLELFDLRVLGDDGKGDEFAVMAALQFVRALNTRADYLTIHGVNLSMSLKHDVANYACGRTPVCDEVTRLVATGSTVVAAAGNLGYVRNPVQAFDFDEGYRSISITDPGNAEDVITVGATHGYRPLTYGVSYFSSRGPTGDGRRKPDVVAPGEKIWSAVPQGGVRTLDGTSMAAPHVSGCAALLMARHRELIGDPARVKRVLCSSATDLGREPYFQGQGLVDVLRAIQSM